MTYINKQIEEEAREILAKADKLPLEANYFGSVDHIKYSANEILKLSEELEHSSRWRKVEGELPPIDDAGVSINVLINVRLKSNNQDLTCVIEGFYDFDIKGWFLLIPLPEKYKIGILGWKPID